MCFLRLYGRKEEHKNLYRERNCRNELFLFYFSGCTVGLDPGKCGNPSLWQELVTFHRSGPTEPSVWLWRVVMYESAGWLLSPSANTLISRMTSALHYSTAVLCACWRLGDRLSIKGRRKVQDVLGREAITHIWGEAFVWDPAKGFDVMVSFSLPFLFLIFCLSSTSLAASPIARGSRVAQSLLVLPQGLHSRLQLSAHI